MFENLIAIALLLGAVPAEPAAKQPTATPASSKTVSGRPRLIPTADFARTPPLFDPRLSPDGKNILARFDTDGKTQIIGVYDIEAGTTRFMKLPEKLELRWYRWAGPNRILISVAQTIPWFGGEAQVTRLVAYDLARKALVRLGGKSQGLEGDDLLYVDPSGDWGLLSFQKTIYDYPSVSRVDFATNQLKEVVKPRPDVWEWYADNDGVVRAGIGFSERAWSMVYRRSEQEKFHRAGKAKYDDEEAAMDLLSFGRQSDEGYILSNKKTGRYALYRYNFVTKELGEEVLASPTNDISGFDVSDDGTSLVSAYLTEDHDRIVWYDPEMKRHQSRIDAAIKSNENWIRSRSRDDSLMLVWSGASNDPGAFYLYRPAKKEFSALTAVNDLLHPAELAPSRYVTYKARDGLEIPAYLTLPLGRGAKGLPLIILPHGGPYDVRDNGDFDPEVQFLANRGYVVLQPNFRGSGSYGKDFYEKGEGQWGRQMQDDLDDGMDWLANQGTIDPRRVCIVGGSYGGYAALWGATRNPERYRCAASVAGVSDLGRQLKYQLSFRISKRYRKDWRRTVEGTEHLDPKTVSPLYAIDRLKVPLLLVHGDADQTVPIQQSALYVEAARKAGKDVEFYTYPNEGHGFSSSANLKDWLDRLEAFLMKHNPPD